MYYVSFFTVEQESTPNRIKNIDVVPTILKEASFRSRKWMRLGEKLGISKEALDNVNGDSIPQCLQECLAVWAKEKSPTWKDLIDALNAIGEAKAAEHISKYKYVQPVILYFSTYINGFYYLHPLGIIINLQKLLLINFHYILLYFFFFQVFNYETFYNCTLQFCGLIKEIFLSLNFNNIILIQSNDKY